MPRQSFGRSAGRSGGRFGGRSEGYSGDHLGGDRPGGRARTRSAERGPSQRQLRVGELIRHALSEILGRGDIRDVDLAATPVTITEVKASPDMHYATVFCVPLGGRNTAVVIAALNRHKAFLRGELGHAVKLRFTPELRFVEDTSFAEADKIETILKSPDVQRDLAPKSKTEEEDGADGTQEER